jgi:hypothetical protein
VRKEQFYINKYGPEAGSKIYELLQKEAVHARWKAAFRKKLKQCEDQLKKLKARP